MNGARVSLQGISKAFDIRRERVGGAAGALGGLLGLHKKERFWAVRDLSLEVQAGELVGVIGQNGHGKSTFLKMLAGVMRPTEGRIHIRGRLAPVLGPGAGLHHELTGRENIYLVGSIFGMSRRQVQAKLDGIVGFAELAPWIDIPVKRYSGGMLSRLSFSVASHSDPHILLLDEAFAAGDTAFREKCGRYLKWFASQGGAVVMVSHTMEYLAAHCGRVLWIEHGRIKMIGPAAEVTGRYLQETVKL